MNTLDFLLSATRPLKTLCPVPRNLRAVSTRGEEVRPSDVGTTRAGIQQVWEAVRRLYATGLHPAIQLCVRREGAIVMHRAIGCAAGNGPEDPPEARRVRVTLETPFLIYSASKAITAMLIHMLDESGELHLDDRICDFIPEFARHGKEWITIRHILAHRAGIPNLPPGSLDLDLLDDPEHVIELLAETRPIHRAGRRLAYHAVTGGFILGEVVRRSTGQDIRTLLRKRLKEPLGMRWFDYGVGPQEVGEVAQDARTGLPVWPPLSWIFERTLGTSLDEAVRLAHDPRFLTGVVPAANVVCTAEELSAFYQCLLEGGQLAGTRVFDPRTVRHATQEQSYLEFDLTLGMPLRYGLGFMLGAETVSPFGVRTPHAFGHVGLSNIFSWADPDRRLAVALMTSGKPSLSLDAIRLFSVLLEIGRAFPPVR